MKKLLFLLTLGVAMPAVAQDQNPPTVQTAPAPDTTPEAAPFEWRLRLRAGQKFLTTSEMSNSSLQQMPTMPGARKKAAPTATESTSQTKMTIEQNVLSSDESGARVEVVYREISQNSKVMQGDKVIYDSAHPPAALQGMEEMLQSMVGARISYLLSPTGQISDIQGVEEYLKRLGAGLEKSVAGKPGAAAVQQSMREMTASFLSPEMLKNSLSATYHTMPTTAVVPGANWKYTLSQNMSGTTFTHNGQSTFVSRENGVITLTQQVESSTDAGAQFKVPLPASPNSKTPAPVSQLDLRGTATGETLVDEQSGMTLQSRMTQEMEGELIMSGAAGKGSVLSIPMKIKAETKTTTQEVKTTP